jgi:hypothetical protein
MTTFPETPADSATPSRTLRRTAAASAVLALLLSGCRGELETKYGVPSGESVNGFLSFIDMLRQRGCRVRVERALSKKLEKDVDVLVVFHHDFGPISAAARKRLEGLLSGGKPKQVFLVLRDWDNGLTAWDRIIERTPADTPALDRDEQLKRQDRLRSQFNVDSSQPVTVNEAQWYSLTPMPKESTRYLTDLTDRDALMANDPPAKGGLRLPVRRRFAPAWSFRRRWWSGSDCIMASRDESGRALHIIANGSFLLNGGMVHRENRKLTHAIVRMIADSKPSATAKPLNVTIVASANDIPDRDRDSSRESGGRFRVFSVYPSPVIIGHLVAALLVFCWHRFPLFGRARSEEVRDVQRFGRHVEALGDLLAGTRDSNDALARVRRWRRAVRHERTTG